MSDPLFCRNVGSSAPVPARSRERRRRPRNGRRKGGDRAIGKGLELTGSAGAEGSIFDKERSRSGTLRNSLLALQNSLLGGQKFPAPARREFHRKLLKLMAV